MGTSKFFQRQTKLQEAVGQVQFVVFEKINLTSAYLFQIAQEKSWDYVWKMYIKNSR